MNMFCIRYRMMCMHMHVDLSITRIVDNLVTGGESMNVLSMVVSFQCKKIFTADVRVTRY